MDWDSAYITELIERALAEDAGTGDATVAATIPPNARGHARIVAKQEFVCAGIPLAGNIFHGLDPQMIVELRAKDGQAVNNGEVLLHLSGKAAAILTGFPLSSRPVVQVTFEKGLPCRNSPVVRSST